MFDFRSDIKYHDTIASSVVDLITTAISDRVDKYYIIGPEKIDVHTNTIEDD